MKKYIFKLFFLSVISGLFAQNSPKEYVQLKSFNIGNHFLRHQDGVAKISPLNSKLAIWDATWIPVPGLANSSEGFISFRSSNYPNTFLRHQNGTLIISSNDGSELFKKDATWKLESGKANSDWISLRTFQWPSIYARHQNGILKISEIKTELDKKDATWKMERRNDLLTQIPVPAPPLLVGADRIVCKIDSKKQWRHLYVALMADGHIKYNGELRNTGITGYHSRIVVNFYTKNMDRIAEFHSKAYAVDGEDLDGHTETSGINDLVKIDAKIFKDIKENAHSIQVS